MLTINLNSVETGAVVYLNGAVEFSRIKSRLEGAELDADNARRIANGMSAFEKAHTRMTINNVSVVYANPACPTLAEKAIEERLYTSPKHPERNLCYTAQNKSKYLPEVFCRDSITSTTLETVVPEGEIAVNTNVTIVLRIFETKLNKGVSLDAVIVNEKPVRYASAGASVMTNTLQARGFTVMPATEGAVDAYRANLAAQPAPAPMPTPAVTSALVQTAPAPAPYMQPAANTSAPVQPTSWSAQPAAQSVSPAPVQAAPAAQPAPEAAAPAAPSLPVPPKGYEYDKSGRIVPIQANAAPANTAPATPAGGITLT